LSSRFNIANVLGLAFCWIVSLLGCLVIAGALIALYFLLVKQVHPGEPLFFDVLVPPLQGALIHLANGIVLAAAPPFARLAFRRWRRSRS
jgi:hypothetical protein